MMKRNGNDGEFGFVFTIVATLALAISACASAPPILANITTSTLHSHDPQPEVTREGITISVTPITHENRLSASQIHRLITYTQTGVNSLGQPAQAQAQVDDYVVPLPAFQVRIANHTGHVLRFTQTIFRLQDSRSRNYQLFASTDELAAWNVQNDGQLASNAEFMQQERAVIAQVPLLNRNTELLNGDEYSGYLVFNMTPYGGDLLDQIERMTLRIAEVPVDMNDAGVASRTTEFQFVFDKSTYQQAATCPAGTTQPSWSVCHVATASSGGSQ
jgi:hypothetical protein